MDVVYRGATATRRYTPEQLSRISIELSAEDGEVGVGNTVLDDDQASDQAVSGHQYKVSEGNALLIDGWIADQDRTRGTEKAAPHREGTYTILDPNRLFGGTRMVSRVRSSETDRARVLAFAALDLAGVDTTWVLNTDTVTLPAKTYTTVGWGELMTDVLAASGKTLFIHDKANGSGRCLHYHLRTQGHTCGLSISDVAGAQSATVWAPQNPVRQRRAGDLVNDVLARDQANRTVRLSDGTSVFIHNEAGLRHDGILDFEASSTAELTTKAQNYLNRFAEDQLTYYCTIGPLDQAALGLIRVGDLITVTSGVFGLTSEVLRIAHMTLTLSRDASGNPITTGTGGSALWDAALEMDKGARVESAIYRNRPAPRNPPPFVPGCDFAGGESGSIDATVTADGSHPPADPELTVDDDTGTRSVRGSFVAGAGTTTSYWIIDLGATNEISQLQVVRGTSGFPSVDWDENASGFDGTFLTLAFGTTAGVYTSSNAEFSHDLTGLTHTLTFDTVQARYIRLGILETSSGLAFRTTYDIAEIYVSGSECVERAPDNGQYTTEQITLGAGGSGQTNYPYVPGSLQIIGSTVTADETDPATGEFETTLPEGTVVNVTYQIASNAGTGAGNSPPTGGTNTTIPPIVTDALLRKHGGGDQIHAHGNTGAAETFDLANGNLHTATLDANSTFTFTGPESGAGRWLTLKLTQDGTGGRTVTWPGSVEWPDGTPPTLASGAGEVTWLTFVTTDGGTTWFGFPAGSGGGGGGSDLGWFNVMDYGATGDGTTDDTSTIDDAIDALIAAGRGVLYFPAGHYKVTAGLTSISVPCIVMGDGSSGRLDGTTTFASKISFTHGSQSLFTVTTGSVRFRDLALVNTAASTPTDGAGITVPTGGDGDYAGSQNHYADLNVAGFYRGIDIQSGALWNMERVYIINPVLDGVRASYAASVDAGDQSFDGCTFQAGARTGSGAVALRIHSGGGAKITNCKVNYAGGNQFTHGISVEVANSSATSILLVTNSSFENVSGNGINGTTGTGTSTWSAIVINGCQFGLHGNTSGNAIELVGTDAGDFSEIIIDDCVFTAPDANNQPAIQITNCDRVIIGSNLYRGFDSLYNATTCTNVTDHSAGGGSSLTVEDEGSALATAATTLDFVGAGVTASGTGAEKTVTIPGVTEASVRDAGRWEIVMVPGITDPPEPVENVDGSDYLYAWVTG